MGSSARPYLAALGLIAAAAAIDGFSLRALHAANLSTLFVLAVLIVAIQWGRRPALFAALVGAVVFDLCLIPPYFRFAPTDLPNVVTASGFFVVALATGTIASRARELTGAQEARARAEASVQAKDEILNQISHELRTPLNAVLAWAQLLRQAPPHGTASHRALDGVERSARSIGRLVDDLLTAARINSGKLVVRRQPTLLAPIVTHAADLLRAQAAEQGLALTVELAGDRVVLADPQRVEQIVVNLLSNAVKFTPAGGAIRVLLECDRQTVRLTVRDTGIGIRREFLPRVFDQFSQADDANLRQGLGLGLAIVHSLVVAHGAAITVDSAGEGKGTSVVIAFPWVEGASTADPGQSTPA